MAATIRPVSVDVSDAKRIRILEMTGDTSYPTGGYSLTPAMCDLKNILYVDLASAGGHIAEYDYVNQKVKLFKNSATPTSNPLVEVSNATNVSTVVWRMMVIGDPA